MPLAHIIFSFSIPERFHFVRFLTIVFLLIAGPPLGPEVDKNNQKRCRFGTNSQTVAWTKVRFWRSLEQYVSFGCSIVMLIWITSHCTVILYSISVQVTFYTTTVHQYTSHILTFCCLAKQSIPLHQPNIIQWISNKRTLPQCNVFYHVHTCTCSLTHLENVIYSFRFSRQFILSWTE